ncbi:DNA-binding domain-containing protein [Luteimonas mephitis]|uniref:HvfC family RiPP maturation protein n=1 Tax=Luteimonas mephitis TaxID=83615 RepID=UPI000419B75F|nr:putative DNA-binding domain-containing protein [Luteimonas mephitis]
MSPESSPAPSPGGALQAQLDALAAWIREPATHAPPPGIEQRRLDVYRELFFNNVSGLLGGNFPVLRRIHGDAAWQALVHAFYRDHGSRTPLFTELPREFLRFLESRDEDLAMPWLRELAHYEWVELALQISEATRDDIPHDPLDKPGADPAQALLAGRPLPSPLAWPLAYAWPVHRIGPDHRPLERPAEPTLLLLRRESDGRVSFHTLGALTFRLLQRLDQAPGLSGREQLLALAAEAGAGDAGTFLHDGAAMLAQLHREGTILGTRL